MARTSPKFIFSAIVLTIVAITPASATVPAQCGNRLVNAKDSWPPLAPGCRRLACNPMYEIAKDEKGTYCIQHFGCGIYCKPKPPG
jgi:hypothetical protein